MPTTIPLNKAQHLNLPYAIVLDLKCNYENRIVREKNTKFTIIY